MANDNMVNVSGKLWVHSNRVEKFEVEIPPGQKFVSSQVKVRLIEVEIRTQLTQPQWSSQHKQLILL